MLPRCIYDWSAFSLFCVLFLQFIEISLQLQLNERSINCNMVNSERVECADIVVCFGIDISHVQQDLI